MHGAAREAIVYGKLKGEDGREDERIAGEGGLGGRR